MREEARLFDKDARLASHSSGVVSAAHFRRRVMNYFNKLIARRDVGLRCSEAGTRGLRGDAAPTFRCESQAKFENLFSAGKVKNNKLRGSSYCLH